MQCLTEVAGATVIDYVLRSLASTKISDIYILTSRHKKEIEDHLSNYKRKVIVLYSEKCNSLGDALREISALRILKENFLLLKGTCVMNLNINTVFDRFEGLTKARKDVIMMKVFTKNSTLSELRSQNDNPLLLLDQDNAILYMENLSSNTVTLQGKLVSQERASVSNSSS
jgi:NDP-sugar pyrophosphorylase family protein